MTLSIKELQDLAFLARIKVPENELEEVAGNLSSIMDFIKQLNEADTEGVEPLTSICDMSLRTRVDIVTDGGYAEKLISNAPLKDENYFMVPKVVE